MDEKTEIFCCYAHKHEDQQLLSRLRTHLASFEREGLISVWHDTDISPGAEWEEEINKHLDTADIILLLVSPSFIASEYCYSREMKRAMERHNLGEARVIPIILRPVSWQNAPFGKLQALPIEAKPVTDPGWHSLDDAFLNVVEGIRRIVALLLVKQHLARGDTEYNQHHYSTALSIYEQILLNLDPNCADAYLGKGKALEALDKSREALAAYNQAIRLKSDNASYYEGKGQALLHLYDYEEALEAFKQAIKLSPASEQLHIQRGNMLQYLKRYEEALEAYNRAISLNVNIDPQIYYNKGIIHEHLARQAHNIARQHGYTAKDQNSLQELNTSLEKLANEMVDGLEMPILMKNILETITRALGADASSLYLIDPVTRILSIQSATGYHRVLVDIKARYDLDHKKGLTASIARTGQKFTARSTDELHRHPEWEGKYKKHQGGREPNAFLGIPLKVLVTGGEERTIGVLKIEDIRPNPHHPESYFTDQDIILAEMMGSFITTVIQNMRLADDHPE